MEGALKGLFGGGDDDDQQRGQAEDFFNRYSTGDPSEGYDPDEAHQHFSRVAQQASPEDMRRATQRSLEQMPENQRAELNEMLRQRQSGQGGVDIQRSGQQGQGGGGGVEDLLGGLMGGGGGGSAGGGGLGGILGGLMGGGQQTGRSGQIDRGNAGGGGIGDLMGSTAGKALIGGIAAFAMKEMMDRRK